MVKTNKSIILASGSPRRKELLSKLGVPFTVKVSNVEENFDPSLPPEKIVEYLSLLKAQAVVENCDDNSIVIGADTIIFFEDKVLGKPEDVAHAKSMLRELRGRRHEVITGLAVIDNRSGRKEVASVTSKVTMRDYTSEEIDGYVASGEPMDKAGSYAIQGLGRCLIEKYEGCFDNIVGLPLCEVVRILKRFSVEIDNINPCSNHLRSPVDGRGRLL